MYTGGGAVKTGGAANGGRELDSSPGSGTGRLVAELAHHGGFVGPHVAPRVDPADQGLSGRAQLLLSSVV